MGKITDVLWPLHCGRDMRWDVIRRNRAWPSVMFFYPSDVVTVTATGKTAKGLITIMANPLKSSFKLKVLYGESDEDVLASQAASIQKAGHEVATAVGRKGVEESLRRQTFDLVILGPTLTRNDRHHLPYMVKKAHPGTRVLVMHADGGRHPQVDANIDTGRSIDDLLERIAEMLAQEAVKSSF